MASKQPNVCVKVGDSMSNSSRIIRLFVGRLRKKTVENVASNRFVRISGERLKRGSPNVVRLPGTASLANLPHMTSYAASGRLQNAIKYCTKVHKTGAAGIKLHNSVTV